MLIKDYHGYFKIVKNKDYKMSRLQFVFYKKWSFGFPIFQRCLLIHNTG